jgi:hypothetical protein
VPQADPDPQVPEAVLRVIHGAGCVNEHTEFLDWCPLCRALGERDDARGALRGLVRTVTAEARELERDLSLDVLRALAQADTALGE